MSGGYGSAALHQVLEGVLDFFLGGAIARRCRFVQNENLRVDQQSTGNRDTLTFPAGEGLPPFADDGIIAMRQAQNKVVRMGSTGSGHNLFARGIRFAVSNVLGDGAEEEEGFLQYQADMLAVFR